MRGQHFVYVPVVTSHFSSFATGHKDFVRSFVHIAYQRSLPGPKAHRNLAIPRSKPTDIKHPKQRKHMLAQDMSSKDAGLLKRRRMPVIHADNEENKEEDVASNYSNEADWNNRKLLNCEDDFSPSVGGPPEKQEQDRRDRAIQEMQLANQRRKEQLVASLNARSLTAAIKFGAEGSQEALDQVGMGMIVTASEDKSIRLMQITGCFEARR